MSDTPNHLSRQIFPHFFPQQSKLLSFTNYIQRVIKELAYHLSIGIHNKLNSALAHSQASRHSELYLGSSRLSG
jgi:hypothetical protein